MNVLLSRRSETRLDRDGSSNAMAMSPHTDAGFTLRTYTHLMPSSDERTRNTVDDAFACYIGATSGPEQVVDSRADLHSYVSSKEFTMNCAAWVT
jgi:hypothetical protein